MFEYLSGILKYRTESYCVLDVGGVGFRIYTSSQGAMAVGNVGEQVTFYIYMSVKEDDISLYGFASRDELASFEMLISVSGVGPKVALCVLAAMSPSDFSLAVATGDYKSISRSKGVGPKLAQRIILELKDKIAKDLQGDITSSGGNVPGPIPAGYISEDAVAALMVLGYSSKEASDAVRKVYQDGMQVEEVVRLALKNI
ncbi:MAG: Holliday junction branch migration protein RuvA [Clostridia bacterium]|nr:Holliday junction branch migration protein RuvA [Clostridia bacterium]